MDKKVTTSGKISRQGIFFFAAAAILFLIAVATWETSLGKPVLVAAFTSLALGFYSTVVLRSFTFTAWVLAGLAAALCFSTAFQQWGNLKLSTLIVPLVQLIMFGMGTTLSLRDFGRVFAMPWPVFIGVFLQFSVMPVVGYFVVKAFGFEGEVAAGVILIGSCSGGVASNLMTYLAGANVALSVTMTCFSTLLSPIATPLAMKIFAGEFIEIKLVAMMLSILNMIIVPVVAGLIANKILYGKEPFFNRTKGLLTCCFGLAALATVVALLPSDCFNNFVVIKSGLIIGAAMLALVTGAKWFVQIVCRGPENWMDRALPLLSMFGIWFILIIIAAQTRDELLTVGAILIVAAIIHNTLGYLFGYWGCKASGKVLGQLGCLLRLRETTDNLIPEADCRTVAFEVGMQNGGMATGLAMEVLKSHVAALPPNVFGAWMNVSGSLLANWWKRTADKTSADETSSHEKE